MFAVIKKNEGLAKVIDAPSLKAAYDKIMYSEEDMLEPGKYQLINDQNPDESLMFEYLVYEKCIRFLSFTKITKVGGLTET